MVEFNSHPREHANLSFRDTLPPRTPSLYEPDEDLHVCVGLDISCCHYSWCPGLDSHSSYRCAGRNRQPPGQDRMLYDMCNTRHFHYLSSYGLATGVRKDWLTEIVSFNLRYLELWTLYVYSLHEERSVEPHKSPQCRSPDTEQKWGNLSDLHFIQTFVIPRWRRSRKPFFTSYSSQKFPSKPWSTTT